MNNSLRPFHLAFPVSCIKDTIRWYTTVLNCTVGRQDTNWVDFNFYGHQLSAHLVNKKNLQDPTNPVDGKNIPARHFGIILDMENWKNLAEDLKNKKLNFIVGPYIRFKGEKGEQATMFVKDPSDNVLEFKSFKNDSMIFEH